MSYSAGLTTKTIPFPKAISIPVVISDGDLFQSLGPMSLIP